MSSTVTFYPLGNADSTLVKLEKGKHLLFDFGNQGNPEDKSEKRINLSKALKTDINFQTRDYVDVLAITHGDDDHVHGASAFFWLDHAKCYQGEERIKVRELWVPAAMILESGVDGDNRILRQEARHRLINGTGIRVFSRPEKLKTWLEGVGLTLESRAHLITDAGQLVPGFNLDADGAEFFVHSPFAHRYDGGIEDRNGNCLVMQAVFRHEGAADRRMMITADSGVDDWNLIVDITLAHAETHPSRVERLRWDIFKWALR